MFIEKRHQELGITYTQLAQQIGVARQTIDKWKNNASNLKVDNLILLAKALQVHPLIILRMVTSNKIFSPVYAQPTHRLDDSALVDETIPDNSIVGSESTFTKAWLIQNVGSSVWENRSLVCQDESELLYVKRGDTFIPFPGGRLVPSDTVIPIPTTEPGDTVELSVTFVTPMLPGRIISRWKIVDNSGVLCYPEKSGVWCQVTVTGFY